MKTLICLMALVALALADESADLQKCVDEASSFKKCVGDNVRENTIKNFQSLKNFGQDIAKCFEQEGIKGVCTMPSPPAHPQPNPNGPHPAQGAMSFPAPPPEFATCFDGAKNAFLTCFKEKAGIPEGFKPQGTPQQGPHPPPPFVHPHFNQERPEDIKAKVLEVCNNNNEAAEKLTNCSKEVIKPYLPAMIAMTKPFLLACRAAGECAQKKLISAECQAKLQQGRKAVCECHPKGAAFFNTSDECSAARTAIKEKIEAHLAAAHSGATDAHHDLPQHPQMPMDFCGPSPFSMCKQIHEKMEKAHAAFGLPAPPAPAPAPSS